MELPRKTKEHEGATRTQEGMHLCPSCDSNLVQPVGWYEQGGGSWHVELRCPECDWAGKGSYSQPEVDRFDEELDSGAQALIDDLRALTRANMEDEIKGFTEALSNDLILPEDF